MAFPPYTKTWRQDVYPEVHASKPELSQKDKRVVITGGGAGGVGGGIAEAFATAGAAEVVILGRTRATLEASKVAVEGKHKDVKVTVIIADIADPVSTVAAFDAISKDGPIDVFVHNAAYLPNLAPIATADLAELSRSFDINVKGSVNVLQAVLKNIAKDGVIIHVSTGASHLPYVLNNSFYSTSKLAAAKLFDYVHHEHPDLKVYTYHPGVIEVTPMGTKATQQSGYSFPLQDTIELASHFSVWLASPEALFLRGRFVWANWDVTELKEKEKSLQEDPTRLTLGLLGWPA